MRSGNKSVFFLHKLTLLESQGTAVGQRLRLEEIFASKVVI